MNRIEQRNKKLNEEAGKMEVWHSMSYHNHFEGYAEYYEPGEKKDRIRRLYVGEYYRQKLSPVQTVLRRLVYICLFAAASAGCVAGACVPVASNCVWYVNIPQALTIPCVVYALLALVSYVGMPAQTKKGQHRFAVRGVIRGSGYAGTCCLLSAAATALYLALSGEPRNRAILCCGVMFLAAGICFLTICLLERRVSYEVIENTTKAPAGSVIL